VKRLGQKCRDGDGAGERQVTVWGLKSQQVNRNIASDTFGEGMRARWCARPHVVVDEMASLARGHAEVAGDMAAMWRCGTAD